MYNNVHFCNYIKFDIVSTVPDTFSGIRKKEVFLRERLIPQCTLWLKISIPGFSMNILCLGNESPVQRGFFTNSTGNLLPTLGFLGRLYNFCNFAITFSLK